MSDTTAQVPTLPLPYTYFELYQQILHKEELTAMIRRDGDLLLNYHNSGKPPPTNLVLGWRFNLGLYLGNVDYMQEAIDELKRIYLSTDENEFVFAELSDGEVLHEHNEEAFRSASEQIQEHITQWTETLNLVKRTILNIEKMMKKPTRRGGKKHRKK